MKRTSLVPDRALALFALLATLIGLFFVFDAGYARSIGSKDGNLMPPEFKSQIIFFIPSLVAGFMCSRVKMSSWKAAAGWIFAGVVLMLIAVSTIGIRENGAQRWLGVGPFSIQPAEFAKLGCVLYLAAVFSSRKSWPVLKPRKNVFHWMDTVAVPKFVRAFPAILILVVGGLINHEKDLGTAGVIAATAFFMFVPAGVQWKSLVAAIVLSLVAGWVVIRQEPYRLERIENHQNRWSADEIDDTNFQTNQSELGMATGGLAGLGVGNGRAKHLIPATTTDFVMATVGEEFGFIGSLLVLLTLGCLVWRLLYQASQAQTKFATIFLYGIGFWIGIQTCVNMSMANGFLPAIGIPLPFVSSGGSSLMALWCAIGVAQSAIAADRVKKPEAVAVKKATTYRQTGSRKIPNRV
jgi:cell division protein FtsW